MTWEMVTRAIETGLSVTTKSFCMTRRLGLGGQGLYIRARCNVERLQLCMVHHELSVAFLRRAIGA
jgi:hypothetical protein